MVNNTESSATRILLIRHLGNGLNRIHRFQGGGFATKPEGQDEAHACF
jgi:hypothetical protein